jgi:hypothetical protein
MRFISLLLKNETNLVVGQQIGRSSLNEVHSQASEIDQGGDRLCQIAEATRFGTTFFSDLSAPLLNFDN